MTQCVNFKNLQQNNPQAEDLQTSPNASHATSLGQKGTSNSLNKQLDDAA